MVQLCPAAGQQLDSFLFPNDSLGHELHFILQCPPQNDAHWWDEVGFVDAITRFFEEKNRIQILIE